MWDVYVSGNFEMIVAAYNALAMMFSDGHNIYYGAAVLALLKLLITALQKVVDDQQNRFTTSSLASSFLSFSLAHRRGSRC